MIAWVAVVTASILVHEAGHAIAFRRFGHEAEITLTGFGGLTAGRPRVGHPPLSNGQHIIVSLAGPAAGLVLGLLALTIQRSETSRRRSRLARPAHPGQHRLGPAESAADPARWTVVRSWAPLLSMRWPRQGQRMAAGVSAALGALIAVVAIASGYTLGGIMAGILVGMNLGSFRSGGRARRRANDARAMIAQGSQYMRDGQWDAAVADAAPGPGRRSRRRRIGSSAPNSWGGPSSGPGDSTPSPSWSIASGSTGSRSRRWARSTGWRRVRPPPSTILPPPSATRRSTLRRGRSYILRRSPATIDELAARSLALPSPQNTAAVERAGRLAGSWRPACRVDHRGSSGRAGSAARRVGRRSGRGQCAVARAASTMPASGTSWPSASRQHRHQGEVAEAGDDGERVPHLVVAEDPR